MKDKQGDLDIDYIEAQTLKSGLIFLQEFNLENFQLQETNSLM